MYSSTSCNDFGIKLDRQIPWMSALLAIRAVSVAHTCTPFIFPLSMCSATANKATEIVKFMLSKSKNQPLPNLNTEETSLSSACRNKLHEIVDILLLHSPKLVFMSKTQNNVSPLHESCRDGDLKMVELLLQAIKRHAEYDNDRETEVSLDLRDERGHTPLYHACNHGFFDIAKCLIEFQHQNKSRVCLNVNIVTKRSQEAPLHAAVQSGNLEIVRLLLKVKNIEINVEGRPSKETEKKLTKLHQRFLSQSKSKGGIRADDAFVASGAENFTSETSDNKLRKCLSHDHSTPSLADQKTPLQHSGGGKMKRSISAVHHHREWIGNLCVRECPKTPGKLVFQLENVDSNPLLMTPLAMACACYHEEIVKILLLQGARDGTGLACRICDLIQQPDLIKLILSHHTVLRDNSLELRWNYLKLPLCEGSWLGNGAEYYPPCKEGDTGLAKTSSPSKSDVDVGTVQLEGNRLTNVPIELFRLQGVKRIDLSNNKLATLPVGYEDAVGEGEWSCLELMELHVKNNELRQVPACVWKQPKLESFMCSDNKIDSLPPAPGNLLNRSTLTDIDLSHNLISGVPPAFLFQLPNLKSMNLSSNKITHLPGTVWECKTLRELNLSGNQLAELPHHPQNQSRSHHHVQQAAMGKMEMKPLKFDQDASSFSSSFQQSHPSMQAQGIQAYQSDYSSLRELNISSNKFTIFPEAVACFAPNLTTLNVSSNAFEEIDVCYLPPLLQKLVAKRCKISRFGNVLSTHQIQKKQHCQHGEFRGLLCQHRNHTQLPYLISIDLSDNKIIHMQLVHAGFKENEYIKKLSRQSLLYPALEVLNLTNNNLSDKFNPNIGHQMQLKSIKLGKNHDLKRIPMEFGLLKNTNKLTELGMTDLPNLEEPPVLYRNVKVKNLLTYMKSRLKE
jgi:Leucine-rich repeat (LRR) protein